MKDLSHSVLQRLKNKSITKKVNYQLLLQLFCQEEFLRKLSKSIYQKNFILKGGLLLYSISQYKSRPTMDIDFLLKKISNNIDNIKIIIFEIIETPIKDSVVNFDLLKIELLSNIQKYRGVRVKIIGIINNTRTPFHIDFGIGDVVFPQPELRQIQVQLEGFEQPEILTYSFESVIAEKWESIIRRMELNSRMKDYYDIYYLAVNYKFNAKNLCFTWDGPFIFLIYLNYNVFILYSRVQ